MTALVAQARVDGIGDDIDQTIEQGRVIEHGLGGVAAREDDAASLPDGVDGSGEVAKEVAGPSGKLTLGVSHEQVEVVGHDAEAKEADTGVGVLGPCEPLEDGLVDGGFGAEKEARLVAREPPRLSRRLRYVSPTPMVGVS